MRRLFLSFIACVLLTGSAFAAMGDLEFIELCKNGSFLQINSAIKGGADVNARNEEGITPLMAAAWSNPDSLIISALIYSGADVNAKNKAGITPLMYAQWKKDKPEVVEILLEHGAIPEPDNYTPEPKFTQERAWDQIPWTVPPEDKTEFAKRIYTTMKDAFSSRRNTFMRYGEPLNIRPAWHPSALFKEVPYPGDWGHNMVFTNGKRGILWWSKWHVFGVSTYGSKVLGSWIVDSGWSYKDSSIRMPHFWKWYDGRILLFNHFFKKDPVYDDEMAVWIVDKQYLFILVPYIDIRVRGKNVHGNPTDIINPVAWLTQPIELFNKVRWLFGWRPTDKNLIYYLVRLPEVPDTVTLKQIINSLRSPLTPGGSADTLAIGATEAMEKAQTRRRNDELAKQAEAYAKEENEPDREDFYMPLSDEETWDSLRREVYSTPQKDNSEK